MTTEPQRIAYLSTSGQVGGAERSLISLLECLDRTRFAPEVWIGSPGPLFNLLEDMPVTAVSLPLPGALRHMSRFSSNAAVGSALALAQTPAYVAGLAARCRARRPALLHSNGIKMHILAALAAMTPGAPPLVWHVRDFPPFDPRRGRATMALRLLRGRQGRPAAVVANSQAVAAAWAAALPAWSGRVEVIYNGVDAARFAGGGGAAMRASWGLSPQDFVIGMVGNFAPWKGQEVFLRAARLARAALPQLQFVLIGDDVYDTAGHGGRRAALETLAGELGLADAVRFTGFVSEAMPAAYAALDTMVHASTRPEPFGRTLIEAMAAGVPVIAAAAGGPLEIIARADQGVLTPPGDAAALAAAMQALAADPERRARLAAAGRARVSEAFSAAAHARQTMDLYDRLLGRATPTANT